MLHAVFILSHLCLYLRHVWITLFAEFLHTLCLFEQRAAVVELINSYSERSLVIRGIHIFLHHLNGFLILGNGKRIVTLSHAESSLAEGIPCLRSVKERERPSNRITVVECSNGVVGICLWIDITSPRELRSHISRYRRHKSTHCRPTVVSCIVSLHHFLSDVSSMGHGILNTSVESPYRRVGLYLRRLYGLRHQVERLHQHHCDNRCLHNNSIFDDSNKCCLTKYICQNRAKLTMV